MEALAYLYAYSSYEEAEGIEYDFSNLELNFSQIPSATGLSLLGFSVLCSNLSLTFPASAGYVVKTNGGCLNTRWGPGTNYSYAGKCVRNGAALLPVVETKDGWAKLSSGRWVSGDYIRSTSATDSQPVTTNNPASTSSTQYVVKTKGSCLNTRWGPGTNYTYAGKCVNNGSTLLPVVETKEGWAKLSSGRWVSATYIRPTTTNSGTIPVASRVSTPVVTPISPVPVPLPVPVPSTETEDSQETLPPPPQFNLQVLTPSPRSSEVYRKGARGLEIEQIQNKLIGFGFNVGEKDGIFGPQTESAVRNFQMKYGLPSDGVVGPQTLAKLGF